MRYPLKKIRTTQGFGLNPQIYRRFGLRGHNGVDFRVRFVAGDGGGETYLNEKAKIKGRLRGENTAIGHIFLFAPKSGVVMTARNDGKKGYGYHIRLKTDDGEEIVLGHNSDVYYRAGDRVEEGYIIGMTGNTGFSSGPHTHDGQRPKGYNRNNGYAGYEDQAAEYRRSAKLPTVQGAPNNELTNTNNQDNKKDMSTKLTDNLRKTLKTILGVDFGTKLSDGEQDNIARMLLEQKDECSGKISVLRRECDKMAEQADVSARALTRCEKETNNESVVVAGCKSNLALCKYHLNMERERIANNNHPFGITPDDAMAFITSKDWKRAGWTLVNFVMAVGLSYLSYLATDENVAIAATVLPVAQAVAQFLTKKINTK